MSCDPVISLDFTDAYFIIMDKKITFFKKVYYCAFSIDDVYGN